jgi:hypothetical protein
MVMTINLPDLPQAVRLYLDTKVSVSVGTIFPAGGTNVTPGETFFFRVTVTNATAVNGGIALSNVRYQIRVLNPSVATLQVPPSSVGSAIGGGGSALNPGDFVGFFELNPSSTDLSYLEIGESPPDGITFHGKAGSGSAGGTTTITARILANPDINALFPQNENSGTATRDLPVVG